MGTYYSEEDLKKMDEEASVGGFLKGAFKSVVDTVSSSDSGIYKPFHEQATDWAFGQGTSEKFQENWVNATRDVLETGIDDAYRGSTQLSSAIERTQESKGEYEQIYESSVYSAEEKRQAYSEYQDETTKEFWNSLGGVANVVGGTTMAVLAPVFGGFGAAISTFGSKGVQEALESFDEGTKNAVGKGLDATVGEDAFDSSAKGYARDALMYLAGKALYGAYTGWRAASKSAKMADEVGMAEDFGQMIDVETNAKVSGKVSETLGKSDTGKPEYSMPIEEANAKANNVLESLKQMAEESDRPLNVRDVKTVLEKAGVDDNGIKTDTSVPKDKSAESVFREEKKRTVSESINQTLSETFGSAYSLSKTNYDKAVKTVSEIVGTSIEKAGGAVDDWLLSNKRRFDSSKPKEEVISEAMEVVKNPQKAQGQRMTADALRILEKEGLVTKAAKGTDLEFTLTEDGARLAQKQGVAGAIEGRAVGKMDGKYFQKEVAKSEGKPNIIKEKKEAVTKVREEKSPEPVDGIYGKGTEITEGGNVKVANRDVRVYDERTPGKSKVDYLIDRKNRYEAYKEKTGSEMTMEEWQSKVDDVTFEEYVKRQGYDAIRQPDGTLKIVKPDSFQTRKLSKEEIASRVGNKAEEAIDAKKAEAVRDALADDPESAPILNSLLQEGKEAFGKVVPKDTKTATLERIKYGLREALASKGKYRNAMLSSAVADTIILGKRIGRDFSDIVKKDGRTVDFEKLNNAIYELSGIKKEGWFDYKKLPLPNSLKNMLKRDDKVASEAFKKGLEEGTRKGAVKTEELRKSLMEKMEGKVLKVSEAGKAALLKAKSEFKARGEAKRLLALSLTEMFDNLAKSKETPGGYKFYGSKADIDAIKGRFLKRILNANSVASYNRLMGEMGYAIEKANRKAVMGRIQEALKKYRRPETPTSKHKPVFQKERAKLEMMAARLEEYRRTGDMDTLVALEREITLLEKIGNERFRENALQKAVRLKGEKEVAVKMGIQDLAKDLPSNVDVPSLFTPFGLKTRVVKAVAELYHQFRNPARMVMRIVGGNKDNPLYKHLVYHVETGLGNWAKLRREVTSGKYKRDSMDNILKSISKLLPKEMDRYEFGIWMASKQADWDKYVWKVKETQMPDGSVEYTKTYKGNLLGKDFPQTAEAYEALMARLNERFSNKEYGGIYRNIRNLWDDIGERVDKVSLELEGATMDRIENYFPMNFKLKKGPELDDDVGSLFANLGADATDKKFMKTRNYDTTNVDFADFDIARVMERHVKRQGYYAEMARYYRNAYDFLYRSKKDDAVGKLKLEGDFKLIDRFNSNTRDKIKDYMELIKTGGGYESTFLDNIASLASMDILGLNVPVIAKQGLSWLDGVGFVGKRNFASGMMSWMASSELKKFIYEKSVHLESRKGGDITLQDLERFKVGDVNVGKKYLDTIGKPMLMADQHVAGTLWTSAAIKFLVDKKIKLKDGTRLTEGQGISVETLRKVPQNEMTRMVAYADDMVSNVMGSRLLTRTPPILVNKYFRQFFKLQSTFINRFGILTNDIPQLWKSGDKAHAVEAAIGFAVASGMDKAINALSEMYRARYGFAPEDDRDWEQFFFDIKKKESVEVDDVIKKVIVTAANDVPILSNFINIATFRGTGSLALDALKKVGEGLYKSGMAASNGSSTTAQYYAAQALTTFFGAWPAELWLAKFKRENEREMKREKKIEKLRD